MKNLFPIFITIGLFAISCSNNNNEKLPNQDSLAAPINYLSQPPDSIHRKVKFGKDQTYAFMPDSCFNNFILGEPTSFKKFRLANGAVMVPISGERKSMAWYNVGKTEELEAFVTGNEKDGFFPYRFVLQKANQKGATVMSEKHEYINKANFVSGHGVYIGMSEDYVLHVYQSQTMTRWLLGDTLYLQFKPEEKDAKYITRYSWKSYTATYKFVNDFLRRIEYEVDPTEFEKKN